MALVRGLIGYAPAVIVPRLLTLAQVTLLTRYIPQPEFGKFVLVLTIGDALDLLCCNWLRLALSRYGVGRPENLADEAVRAFTSFALVSCGLSLPLAFLFAKLQVADVLPFFICVASYVITNGVARNALTILAVRGSKLPFFAVEALRTGLGFAGVMGLAVSGSATTYVPLALVMNAATALGAVVGTAAALHGMVLRWPDHWGLDRRHYLLPILAGTLVGVALNSADRMVTAAFAGPAALATYAAAITLARQPLEFIFSVVNVRTFPELMEAYERGGPQTGGERMADLISIMAMLALPAAIGLALVAEPLARAFLSPAYVETARIVIPLGTVAGLCYGFKMFVFDQAFHMAKTIWRNIVATVPVTLAGLALMAALSSRYGAAGCIVAVVIQYATALVISAVQATRLVPIRVHADDLARIGLMCALMIVSVVLALSLASGCSPAVQLACAVGVGAVSYAGAGLVLKPRPVRDLLPQRGEKPAGAAAS